jgi:hypothetical protein
LTGKVSQRQKKLEAFLQECGYLHKATGHTFTHPNGHDCSTIDYIFLHQQFDKEMTEVIKLDLLPDNTSDHYSLITQLVASLDMKETMKEKPGFTRTNWEKVDKDDYQQILKSKLEKISFEHPRKLEKHFETLATPAENDTKNYTNAEFDLDLIYEICTEMNNELNFSEKELEEAIRSLNSKKAPDVYGITAEHLKYGGSTLVSYLTELLNNICKADSTPDLIKLGILSPVFKRKG